MAEEYKFETRCIHGNGGLVEGHPYGAVSVPIFRRQHLHIRELEEVPDTTTPVRAIRQGMSLKV